MYASAYGTARRYNRRLAILSTECHPCAHITTDYEFFFGKPESGTERIYYFLYDLSYLGGPLENLHYIMVGYFLTTRLWWDYADELREKWQCPPEIADQLTAKYSPQDALFLHVRRGDYIGSSLDIGLDLYYKTCLSKFSPDCRILVCSNDMEWCRSAPMFKDLNVSFVEENEVNTIFLMSLCGLGCICANSTFSWWGQFLNKVAPDGSIFFPSRIAYNILLDTKFFPDRKRLHVIDYLTGEVVDENDSSKLRMEWGP